MVPLKDIKPNAKTVRDLSNRQVEAYVNSLLTCSEEAIKNRDRINAAIAGTGKNIVIQNPKARVLTYCNKIFTKLEETRCGMRRRDSPTIMVHLLALRAKPPLL